MPRFNLGNLLAILVNFLSHRFSAIIPPKMRKELASAVNFSYMDAGGDGGDIHKEFFSTLRSPLETILKALEQAEIDPEHPYALVVKVPGLRNPLMPFYHLPNACILALAPRPDKKQVIFNISTDLEAKYARWTAYCNFCEEHLGVHCRLN